MLRTVETIKHLPPYIRQFREMINITDTEDPELQLLCDTSEEIKDNNFIITCDSDGATRYENMLGIVPNPYDTVEARRSRILSRWNDEVPYTKSTLKTKLDTLCGSGNYELVIDNDSYEIDLTTHLPLSSQVEELERLLDIMIPANMVVSTNNILLEEAEDSYYMAQVGTDITEQTEETIEE